MAKRNWTPIVGEPFDVRVEDAAFVSPYLQRPLRNFEDAESEREKRQQMRCQSQAGFERDRQANRARQRSSRIASSYKSGDKRLRNSQVGLKIEIEKNKKNRRIKAFITRETAREILGMTLCFLLVLMILKPESFAGLLA